MHVTRLADYGVRMMIELATRPRGARVSGADLAAACGASTAFCAKILQRLVGARLLVSHVGHGGGFELERAPAEISMLDVVTALDGSLCLNDCLPGGGGCARSAWCPGQGVWASAQHALTSVLASERLDRLGAEASRNRARLRRQAPVAPDAASGAAADA